MSGDMTSGARRERQRRIVLSTIRAGFQTARRITSPRADQSAVYRAPAPAPCVAASAPPMSPVVPRHLALPTPLHPHPPDDIITSRDVTCRLAAAATRTDPVDTAPRRASPICRNTN